MFFIENSHDRPIYRWDLNFTLTVLIDVKTSTTVEILSLSLMITNVISSQRQINLGSFVNILNIVLILLMLLAFCHLYQSPFWISLNGVFILKLRFLFLLLWRYFSHLCLIHNQIWSSIILIKTFVFWFWFLLFSSTSSWDNKLALL